MKDAALDQFDNVSLRGRYRALADRSPFLCGQLTFESVENPGEYSFLTPGEWLSGIALPRVGLARNMGASCLGFIERTRKAVEEPMQASR